MTRYVALLMAALFSFSVYADTADMKPWMLKRGKKIFEEKFSDNLDLDEWNAAKGKWKVVKNVLTGVELASDHHPAAIRKEAPMRNVIIQFDFRFDGSPGFSLSMNFAGGHNSRVVFTHTDFMMKKDLDKKDPADFSVILGECAYKFEEGQWYTMLVEYYGREMLARVDTKDNQAFILGEHDYIDNERTSIGFPVRGDSASFDNVKVWEGTLDKMWSARRARLLEMQAARPPIQYDDPKTQWQVAENKLRVKLLAEDPEFAALVKERAAMDGHLRTSYPQAFKKKGGAEEKKRLMAEDSNFKQMSRELNLARKAERDYMHKKDPELGKLYEKANPPRTRKRK